MQLVTELEASEVLATSVHTLRTWRQEGRGPAFVKLGGRLIRYRLDVLEAFIDAGAVTPEERKSGVE